MTRAALAGVVAAVAAIACSKPHTEDASPRPTAAGGGSATASAGGSSAAASAGGSSAAASASAGGSSASGSAGGSAARGGAKPTTGELQVRVEWREVPVAARSSPGRTPCGTPRTASVAPTTTWGIPEALVIVEGAPRPAVPVARITLADCALAPRIAAGGSLAITSAVDRPAKLALRKRGTLDRLADGPAVPVLLPIAGHTVTAALDPGAIYAIETDAAEPELAFVAALPAQISDATGHVVVRDLAPGPHAVTAWLPPRAGQPARTGRGSATVVAGELAELTVVLSP